MSRSFSSIGAFVAFMEGKIAALPGVQRQALDEASKVVLDEAKSLPGTYQDGWPALQAETVARKSTGDSPLLETGQMRDSYKRKVVSSTKAAVGSNNDKAIWQELGTSRGIPPRPVLKTAGVRKEGDVHRIVGQRIKRHFAG